MADRTTANLKAHTIRLGNPNPQMQVQVLVGKDEEGEPIFRQESRPAAHLEQSVTTVEFWDGVHEPENTKHTLSTDNDRVLAGIAAQLTDSKKRYAVAIHEVEQLLGVHSAGQKPDWVDGDDKKLVQAIADYYGCPVGEPTALLTNAGRDAIHAQAFGTAAQPAALNYMALTANATAASTASTTLTAEIATAGGGLIRAQATYAHTAGTNTTTHTKTFTANGTDVLPVTVAKIGTFNAATVGTMGNETLLNATATLTVSGDNVTVTDTDTLG